ncbi:hypothetical protein Tco_1215001 [Tanacetum coccineum]
MVEPEKPKKKKDQIEYDTDVAQRLQAELDEEARLEREREEEASKAANIAEWDDVQAMNWLQNYRSNSDRSSDIPGQNGRRKGLDQEGCSFNFIAKSH